MIYNIESVNAEVCSILREYDKFQFENTGVKLFCEKGEKNYVFYDGERVTVAYTNVARLVYSLFIYDSTGYTGPTECAYENLEGMLDVSRNAVRTVDTVKKWMRYLVLMGYTGIWLYMEDVYEIPEEPYFGYKRGRYSKVELKEMVEYGRKIGLEVVPAIQTLAHLGCLTRWRRFERIFDCADILLADEEETYIFIENMFKSLQESFGGERIHIGMDEAHMVGLGKYLEKHGYTDRASIIVRHLHQVCELAKKYGFSKPMMWNDMFIRLANQGNDEGKAPDEVISLMPENITLCTWNYIKMDVRSYVEKLKQQQRFGKPVYFAGGTNSWNGFTPQNKFGIKATSYAMKGCKKTGVKNFVMTVWGDNGAECSAFGALPVLAYCGSVANGRRDYKALFKALTGIDFNKFMRLDEPNDISEMNDILVQPSKYMLYNDCLQGMFDCTVNMPDGEKYKSIALRLSRLSTNKEWGYLFKTQAMLARLLYVKYSIGVKTRNAYLAGDKETLKHLINNDYKSMIKHLNSFYEAFRYQWFEENKAYGFEIQDYRLGGLKGRILHCKRMLQDYIEGKAIKVEELEEGILNVICTPEADGKSIWYPNIFEMMVSANLF